MKEMNGKLFDGVKLYVNALQKKDER